MKKKKTDNLKKARTARGLILAAVLLGVNMTLNAKTIYDFDAQRINGEAASLGEYKGQVLLVVNTASKCGFTRQYDGLQALYLKYRERGFSVLGFPANNFMHQEPGTEDEIANFCRINFGVTFPLFAKISVRGKNIHPLYAWLTSKEENPQFAGKISWNFSKFLISREGKVIARFSSNTEPNDKELVEALERALEQPVPQP
jgi:glutathione peroxidase-family protein